MDALLAAIPYQQMTDAQKAQFHAQLKTAPKKPKPKSYKEQLLTREMRFLVENKDVLKENSLKAIERGELQYVDTVIYARKQITASGQQQEIINYSTVKQIGLAYFDKNTLPDFYNMIISHIRVLYATNTGTDAAIGAYYNIGAVPPALVNGELLITVNDKPIIEIPLSKFFKADAGAIATSIGVEYRDAIQLKAPKLIPSGTTYKVLISLANGEAIAGSNNSFISVELGGVCTRPK